jgi:hypothetical protein
MNANRFRPPLAVLIVSILTGCTTLNYTPRVSKDEKPAANDAYLYGRFFINAPKSLLGEDAHLTMGFLIECANGEKYTLRFSARTPPQVIKIVPSTCSLTQFVYTDALDMLKSSKVAPPTVMDRAVFSPGKAFYLGDFFARSRILNGAAGANVMEWKIESAKNDYEKTSAEMKIAFPNLSDLPTEDRMIGIHLPPR